VTVNARVTREKKTNDQEEKANLFGTTFKLAVETGASEAG